MSESCEFEDRTRREGGVNIPWMEVVGVDDVRILSRVGSCMVPLHLQSSMFLQHRQFAKRSRASSGARIHYPILVETSVKHLNDYETFYILGPS